MDNRRRKKLIKNIEIYPSPKKICLTGGEVRSEGNIKWIYDETISDPEGYRIDIEESIEIRARNRSGFAYADATLSQLTGDDGRVPCLSLSDQPYKKIRGVHMYLPPSDGLDEFCRILDALAYLKYNTLILEIGA